MAKAKRVQSWGDIDPKVFEAFYAAVEKLRDEMIPRDCDNDSPITYIIVNKMTDGPLNWFAVPRAEIYSYDTHGYLEIHPDKLREMQDETERMLTANVQMAGNALDQYMRLKHHDHYVERESQRSLAERILEKCALCKKKIHFDLFNEGDFTRLRLAEKYPDYPSRYHVDNQECKAFELRRARFNEAHPEYAGTKPEPRWCMNPKCRCRLADYASKKGANDKNVCLNTRCKMDNSKFYPEVTDAKNS